MSSVVAVESTPPTRSILLLTTALVWYLQSKNDIRSILFSLTSYFSKAINRVATQFLDKNPLRQIDLNWSYCWQYFLKERGLVSVHSITRKPVSCRQILLKQAMMWPSITSTVGPSTYCYRASSRNWKYIKRLCIIACLVVLTRGGIGIGGSEQGGLFLKSKEILCLSSIKDKNGHLCQPSATKVLTSCRLLRLQPQAILERNN